MFTFSEHMTAGMDRIRVKGEKMPHKITAKTDKVI
jgi:hypothetical protein